MNPLALLLKCCAIVFLIQGPTHAAMVTSFVNESASITITFSSREQSITFIDVNNGKQNSVVICLGNPCSCNATEFLNTKDLYNITCGSTYLTVTIKHVQLVQHGDMWRYSFLGDSATFITQVYVNVRVSNVSLSTNTSQGEVDTNELTENETNLVKFVCQSSYCRPKATAIVRFSKSPNQDIRFMTPTIQSYNNISDFWQTSATFEVSLNRSMNDWSVSCIATNDQETYVTSRNVYLNIQYPPTEPPSIHGLQNGSVYKVIENREGQLVYSSDKSNPQAQLTWSFENETTHFTEILNGTLTTVRWTVLRNNNSKVTCTSYHILSEPRYISVNVEVLYPPEEITITSTSSPNWFVSGGISIIENTFLKLICSAKGNPSLYSWTGLYSSDTFEVNMYSSRKWQGNCTCIANNFMTDLTENKTVVGMNSKTIHVNVLYPPAILDLAETEVVKGHDVNISCIVTPGKTSTHSVQWMRELEYITRNNSLIIRNVTRKDAGYYSCSVNYTMVPTYGEPKTGLITQNIYIAVLCSPRRSHLTELRKNMSVSLHGSATFSFVALAFPPPDLNWFHIVNSTLYEANNGYIKTLKLSESEIKIDFTLINVALSDYGEYVLTINNTFGGYQQSFYLTKKDQTNEDGEVSDKGIAGLIAGVAVGSAIGTSLIVTVVYIIKRRLHKHRGDSNKFSELKDINTYQNFPQGDIYKANSYERLQNADQRNTYETLQSTCTTESPQSGMTTKEIETTFENTDKQNAD